MMRLVGKPQDVRTAVRVIGALTIAICCATPARAQLNGENLLGDMGVKSASQPEPGVYFANIYYRYFTDSIKKSDGTRLVLDPSGEGSQTIHATVPLAIYVSDRKILGAHYGMMAVMPFANGSLEAPGLALSEKANFGPSDLYVMPLQLGWHFKRADAVAGAAFFAPTGRHAAGASDNLGKGMWSYELSGGSTLYVDEARTISIATVAAWESHTKKDGDVRIQNVTLDDVKVGQLLTLEGGIGKSFLHGAASIGAAYYAQWKLTADQLVASAANSHVLDVSDKHRVFGMGPDVTVPIATKHRLISLVNVRYLWETGAEVKTEGQTLMLTATFPVGGIKIAN